MFSPFILLNVREMQSFESVEGFLAASSTQVTLGMKRYLEVKYSRRKSSP